MDSVFLKIKAGLLELFPDAKEMDIRPNTLLVDLPEWDSLSVVSIQEFLLKEFGVQLPFYVLCDESSTVDDLSYHLEMLPGVGGKLPATGVAVDDPPYHFEMLPGTGGKLANTEVSVEAPFKRMEMVPA